MDDDFILRVPYIINVVKNELTSLLSRYNESSQPYHPREFLFTQPTIFSPNPQLSAYITSSIIYAKFNPESDSIYEKMCNMHLIANLCFLEMCMCVRNMFKLELSYRYTLATARGDLAEATHWETLYHTLRRFDDNQNRLNAYVRTRKSREATKLGILSTLYVTPRATTGAIPHTLLSAQRRIDPLTYALSIHDEMEAFYRYKHELLTLLMVNVQHIRGQVISFEPRLFNLGVGSIDFSTPVDSSVLIDNLETYMDAIHLTSNYKAILRAIGPEFVEMIEDFNIDLMKSVVSLSRARIDQHLYVVVYGPRSPGPKVGDKRLPEQGGGKYNTRKHMNHRRSKKNI